MKNHPRFRTNPSGEVYLECSWIDVAAFSGDGRRLLTVDDVGTAHIWDVECRDLIQEICPKSPLEGTDAAPAPNAGPFRMFIESAALNVDGSLALLGLNCGSAGVFSTESGEQLSRIKEPRPDSVPKLFELVRAICFSPDDTLLAVGHPHRGVSVWDSTGSRCLHHLCPVSGRRFVRREAWGRDTLVCSVHISSDNRYVFAGSADGVACIWDLQTNSTVLEAVDHAASIVALFVTEDHIQWATSDGNVWQSRGNAPPRKILETADNWSAAVFSPSGKHLLTRTCFEEIDWLSLDGGRERLALLGDRRIVSGNAQPFAFGRVDNQFCYLKNAKTLVLNQADSSAQMHPNQRFDVNNTLDEMLSSPEHQIIVTRGLSGQVELWSALDGSSKGVLACSDRVQSMALSRDGRSLACSADDTNTISVFQVDGGELIAHLKGHERRVDKLAFGPDDNWLISTSLDRSVRKWDLRHEFGSESQRIVDQDLEFQFLNILSDGRVLLFFSRGVEVWDSLDERLLEFPARVASPCQVAIAQNERSVFLTAHDHIEQWSLSDGSLVRRIEPEVPRPIRLPTWELNAMIRAESSGFLWQHAGHNYIHVGDGPRGRVFPLSLSMDSRMIAIPCADGVAIVTADEEPELMLKIPTSRALRASWFTPNSGKLLSSFRQLFAWDGRLDEQVPEPL